MKNLVLTIAMGLYHTEMGAVTHPLLASYAKKIGADFKVITEQKISKTTPHWEKFQIAELFDTYDRILFFDTDIIVRGDCPNLFDVVPPERLGAFNEAQCGGRTRDVIDGLARAYGIEPPRWTGAYYNTGVMVLSRIHQALFWKPEQEIFSFYEQSYLNLVFLREQIVMMDLPYRFNRMACMNPLVPEHRLDSYVVHYAGYEDPDPRKIIEAIAHDVGQWRAAGFVV